MRVVYSEKHRLHHPEHDIELGFPVPLVEVPERLDRIVSSLQADGSFDLGAPTAHGVAPIEAVHASGLIAFLRDASASATGELFPDTFLHRGLRQGMHKAPPSSNAGYWCFDTGTPIVAGTFQAALAAVDVALSAADLVLSGERVAYGLTRPPGHHAAHAVYGGFCYFNNAAIAAEYLRHRADKVAVLDLDYHHGNGTQQIFYARPDVFYVSLHADPARAFPYFTGYADEIGDGPGHGATLNIPLPPRVTDDEYLSALHRALEAVVRFAPPITVVSLGVDTYALDPYSDFALTTSAYAECGRDIAHAVDRMVVLQEGGYYLADLGENVRQWLVGATG